MSEQRVAVVTGANTGIGLETARELCRAGYRVIIMARDEAKARLAITELERSTGRTDTSFIRLDLASLASVREAARAVLADAPRIDRLINNAGLILESRQVTVDGFEATFAINHLGPFLLTRLLLDRLAESGGARIVNVSSEAHRMGGVDFGDLMSERWYWSWRVYGTTKLMNILFTQALARRIESRGITSNALHPGAVGTRFASDGDMGGVMDVLMEIGRRTVLLTPAQGARTSVHLALSPSVAGTTGKYFARSKERRPSGAARDEASAERLWRVSSELVGLPA